MAINVGAWKEALVDISVDDDLTAEVDLGHYFKYLLVLIPTITSSTVTVHVAKGSGDTFYPLYKTKREAIADTAEITTAETTSKAVIFTIGSIRHIKIACGSAQAADKTFYVRGFN